MYLCDHNVKEYDPFYHTSLLLFQFLVGVLPEYVPRLHFVDQSPTQWYPFY